MAKLNDSLRDEVCYLLHMFKIFVSNLCPKNLRIAILQLVETSLQHQPGLAMLFLNIDRNNTEDTSVDSFKNSHSCLRIIRKMLANYQHNLERFASFIISTLIHSDDLFEV